MNPVKDTHGGTHRSPAAFLLGALLPSIADFAFLLPILFLLGRMNGPRSLLGDGDTGWHIRTGEWILAHGQVPRQDIFSFTRPGEPWYAWEWLSDILMGWLHQTGGMQAVLLGSVLLLSVTFALLYRLLYRKCGSILVSFALTAIAAGGSSIHWLARPHLFTMLFLVAYYSILERKQLKLLFLLPFASIIWTNLHGGFLAGIILIAGYAGGELLSALVTPSRADRMRAFSHSWRYGLTALACFAASFINPYTWHLHAHLFTYLSNPAYFQNIAEFTSISFRHPLAPFFECMLLLGAATAFWSIVKRRFVAFLLVAVWAHMALLSARNIPLFMIVAAPPVALALVEWLNVLQSITAGSIVHPVLRGIESLSKRLNSADSMPHWYVAGPAALCLLGFLMYGATPPGRLQSKYDPQAYPAAALGALTPSDRIFASDSWGGYLIYCRYPQKVFVDGRSDFYGPAFEKEYSDVSAARYDWEATLASHGVNTVLLPVDSPLSSTLKGSSRWRSEYDDHVAILFRATAEQHTAKDASYSNPLAVTHVETESQEKTSSPLSALHAGSLSITKQ